MAKKIIKSLYGKISLLKGYCPDCKGYYFVKNGELLCCGNRIEIPDIEKIKRESVTSNQKGFRDIDKQKVLEKQNHCCIYCGIDLTGYRWDKIKSRYIKVIIHYDHFHAWIYNQDNKETNLVASCSVCNLLKSTKYFATIDEARRYIILRRNEKGID